MRVKTDDMRLAFHNANKALNWSKTGLMPTGSDHRSHWEETYGVKIIQGPWGDWQEIEFASPADYTAFVLRWS